MVTPGARKPTVVLLHEQLQDPRIWGGLVPVVAEYATVRTVSTSPLHTLGARHWAEHIARRARDVISPDIADLVVAAGGAGEAGIDLVEGGHTHRAVLINPDPAPVAEEFPSLPGELLEQPEIAMQFAEFAEKVGPYTQDLRESGTLSEDGIEAMIDASLGNVVGLSERHQQLVRRITEDQLRASFPLETNIESQLTSSPEQPNWLALLIAVADRCAIAFSTENPLVPSLEQLVRERAATVEMVTLEGPSAYPWLSSPGHVSELIYEQLQRNG